MTDKKKPTRILDITAKCRDLFSCRLIEDGNVTKDYDGYVPEFMPGEHWGDYVELQIDIDTGQIVNWKRPTKSQLSELDQ